LRCRDIPKELIEAKRIQLKIKRKVYERTKKHN
jgi:hypothetical protein